jgi:CRISPR/Cas system-associated endonuclease/helicase Cas3
VWIAILALALSICALCFSAWLFLELSKKLSTGDLKSQLAESSAELNKTYARSVKEIETEWDNMYEKFARLAGRMDRKRALEPRDLTPLTPPGGGEESRSRSRSDLLRGRK